MISIEIKIFKYLLSIFLICIGIVIGIAIRHYYEIPMNESINMVDVAAWVTTIFLAVLLVFKISDT